MFSLKFLFHKGSDLFVTFLVKLFCAAKEHIWVYIFIWHFYLYNQLTGEILLNIRQLLRGADICLFDQG